MGFFDFFVSKLLGLLGNAEMLNRLGVYYEEGRVVSINKPKACEYYRKAANKQSALGSMNLARCYENGWCETNYVIAVELYMRSASNGIPWALNKCGSIFESGQYVPRDIVRAVDYYEKAAKNGSACGAFNAARIHEAFGNMSDAEYWRAKSVELGGCRAVDEHG